MAEKTERGCTLEWLPVKTAGAAADQRPSYELQLMTPSRQHEFQTVRAASPDVTGHNQRQCRPQLLQGGSISSATFFTISARRSHQFLFYGSIGNL